MFEKTELRVWMFAVTIFALTALARVETVRYVVFDPVDTFKLTMFEV